MGETCQKCGLPNDLCVCETIAKEVQRIYIKTVKRRYGKLSTVIEGMDPRDINIKELAKKLKSELACGGTVKENTIELQGDHKKKSKDLLIRSGFSEGQITMS